MNFLKRKNWFNLVAVGMLLVVLLTSAFLPVLPNPPCERISYATLLKNEWNKRQHKQVAPAHGCTEAK